MSSNATIPTPAGFNTGKGQTTAEKGGNDPYLRINRPLKQRVGRIMTSRVSRNGTPLSSVPPTGSPYGGTK